MKKHQHQHDQRFGKTMTETYSHQREMLPQVNNMFNTQRINGHKNYVSVLNLYHLKFVEKRNISIQYIHKWMKWTLQTVSQYTELLKCFGFALSI